MDELRRCGAGRPTGGSEPRHGKPLPAPIAAAFRKAVGGTLHQIIPFTNTPLFLTGVMPSSNTVSTADELSRFAEILRRGGELDGVRVMQPETLRAATTECRRLRPDLATGLGAAALGYRIHAGIEAVRTVRARCPPRSVIPVDQHRHLGRPRARACGWAHQQRQAGRHREANRYTALMDRIAAEIPRVMPSEPLP